MADDPQPAEQEQPAGAEPEVLDAVPVPEGAVTTSAVAEAMERQHEELEHFSPSGRALVIADPGDETGVLTVLDRHDELLILNRIQSKATAKLFYSFKLNGQLVTELSVQGVHETVGEMNATGKVHIGIDRQREPRFEVELADTEFAGDVEHVVCTVYAFDARTQTGAYGTFSQPRKFKLTEKTAGFRRRDGKYVPDDLIVTDPFARQKALNKAERNALRKLIPEFIAQTMIAAYTGNAALVQEIKVGPGAAAVAELPPPLTDDAAKAKVAEAHEIYAELQRHDPGGRRSSLTPALFHAYLSRAEHAHDRLDDFLVFLRDRRDAVAGAQTPAGA